MTDDLLTLCEDERVFKIEGNAIVYFSKTDGLVMMYKPLKGAIERENIRGLGLCAEKSGAPQDLLYLSWRRAKGKLTENTHLGRVLEPSLVRNTFIGRVNQLYEYNYNHWRDEE